MNKLSLIKQNIIANFAGKLWVGIITIAFVPVYIKFIGIEAYGLIGVFVSLLALFSVLDMGLSTTLNRELAKLTVLKESNQDASDLVRTFELIYWLVGIIIGGGLVALAPLIASHWLNFKGLTFGTVKQAISIMGVIVIFQWPVLLYSGGLMGLERQVLLNWVRSILATIQGVGAVLVLWLVSPTIQAYFIWQIIISAAQTLVIGGCLWTALPQRNSRAIFKKKLWINNWRFASGVTGITLFSIILTQLDKVVLSKLLTLDLFGYYSLAAMVASVLNYIANPIFSALFPRLAQVACDGKETFLNEIYHKGCQLVSILIFPIGIMGSLFSKELLSFWVSDPTIVRNTHFLVSLLITGTALNAIMVLPLALQLAYGWTKLSFYKNVVSVIFFIPLLFWLITRYGAVGAAITWIILNTGYVLIEIPIMHRRLLKSEMWRWYFIDVGLPLVISLCIGILSRILIPVEATSLTAMLSILMSSIFAFLLSALAASFMRVWLKDTIFKYFQFLKT